MTVLLHKTCVMMDCPREVVIWNYFDHEHVVGTHYKHYETVRVIEEMNNWALSERTRRLPLIGDVSSMDFVYLKDDFHIKARHFGLLKMEQDIEIHDIESESCLVINSYRLHVPWFLGWCGFLWSIIADRWFWIQWQEDVLMRRRRWRVWKLGFIDFAGLDYVNKGIPKLEIAPRPYSIELPIVKSTTIRTKGFPRLFSKSEEVGYGN